jgi:hypothetical protein
VHPHLMLVRHQGRRKQGWQKDWARAEDQLRLDEEPRKVELELELRRIWRENSPKEEHYEIHRKIREHSEATERKVATLTREFESMKKHWENELAFYKDCIVWIRSASSKLEAIKTQDTQELKRIEKL